MTKHITITIAIDTDATFCHESLVTIKPGLTAQQILQDYINQQAIDIDLTQHKMGVFGKPISLDTIINESERLEAYQPLKLDPKQARRLRAERNKPKNR